MIEW